MIEQSDLGRTLIIVNPAAQSGAAGEVGERLQRFLSMYLHGRDRFELVRTEGPRHAIELAADAARFDSVLAVGGDGIIHEVANGLMHIERDSRPALGVVPVGSGNDFAKTLGIPEVSCDTDLARVLTCERTPFDVGRVEYAPAQGPSSARRVEYFVETCSFGLDAAIGLGTYTLRTSTGLRGAPLYTLSGLRTFGLRYRDYPATVTIGDAEPQRIRTLIFAIQLGPTYGSGYRICPDADPADGLFDICYASGPAPRVIALPLFLSAKDGHHLGSNLIHAQRTTRVELDFDEADYPIQADGERIEATRATVTCLPAELDVLKPTR